MIRIIVENYGQAQMQTQIKGGNETDVQTRRNSSRCNFVIDNVAFFTGDKWDKLFNYLIYYRRLDGNPHLEEENLLIGSKT